MSGTKRSISTSIWSDEWFESLDSDYKLLWLYLLSNSKTNMIGVYELPSIKRLSFEVGLSVESIRKAFELFTKDSKALFFENYIFLVNWTKHQSYNPNMKKSALNSFEELPENIKNIIINNDLNPLKALCNDCKIISKHKGTVSKDKQMLSKIELESEYEVEKESEIESECEKEVELKKKYTSTHPQIFNFDESSKKQLIDKANQAMIEVKKVEVFIEKMEARNWMYAQGQHLLPYKDLNHVVRELVRYNNSGWLKVEKKKEVDELTPEDSILYEYEDKSLFID